MENIEKIIGRRLVAWAGNVTEEEFERRMALIRAGCESAKKRDTKKQAYIRVKYGWRKNNT